jgi:hypothetical protein
MRHFRDGALFQGITMSGLLLVICGCGLVIHQSLWGSPTAADFPPTYPSKTVQARIDRFWRAGKLATGTRAPNVRLQALEGSGTFELSHHRGVKPVVLVFGSFT